MSRPSNQSDDLRPTTTELNSEYQLTVNSTQSVDHSVAPSSDPSFVIEFPVSRSGSSAPLRIRYSVPTSVLSQRDPGDETWARQPLLLQDALILPSPNIMDRLVQAYFESMFPAFPVLDRRIFNEKYSQGQASPLILQCICLVGFTIASDDIVRAAGYSSRAIARKTHYLRAKALYDADHETDRLNIVSALLLLGFWWESPHDQKDTCYWVGCALLVAQSMGLHRSYV